MSSKPHPPKQAKSVPTTKGVEHLIPSNLLKITPAMLRAVQATAEDKMVHEIAQQEGVSIYCINRRLRAARTLLGTCSTIAAYRLLLLARKIKPK